MNKTPRAPSSLSTSASTSAVEVKSKFGAEFRRFSLVRSKPGCFEDFYGLLQHVHRVPNTELLIGYADLHGDLLPINNDDNYLLAIATAAPLLRLFLQRKEESDGSGFASDSLPRKKPLVLSAALLRPDVLRKKPPVVISLPRDFRPVSSVIDVDVLPESHRRVRLFKHGLDKPLGFYIRDGSSVRVTPQGLEKVPGIFISRMVPGGLAESTGLLAVNDEVLEVNGIEVSGKSLDQVTDMMIANSHNLIITVKPANQRNNVVRSRDGAASGSWGRSSDSFYGYASYSGPAHIIQNFPEGAQESDDEEDLVIEAQDETNETRDATNVPRYEPHLDLRTTGPHLDPNGPHPDSTGPNLDLRMTIDPSNPPMTFSANGLLRSSVRSSVRSSLRSSVRSSLRSSLSLDSLDTATNGSSPRTRERRSLEEDGTIITL